MEYTPPHPTRKIQWFEKLASDRAGIETLARQFHIHPLAVEDCFNSNQRAKFDDFEIHQLLVWFVLVGAEVYELEFVIFPELILLVTADPPPQGSSWFEYLKLTSEHPDGYHLLYQALDRAMDLSADQVLPLYEAVDRFEQSLFEETTEPRRLLKVKRQLAKAEFALAPLVSVVAQLRGFLSPKDDLRWRLMDLHDHAERVRQELVFYRSQISGAMDMYWGITGKRVNDRMKKLTLLASVSVPLSVWSSFWGMNFEAIPYRSRDLFYIALGLMILSVAGIYGILKAKGYWEKE